MSVLANYTGIQFVNGARRKGRTERHMWHETRGDDHSCARSRSLEFDNVVRMWSRPLACGSPSADTRQGT